LPLNWREPDFVRELGRKIKETVTRELGESVKVSVGAAPNRYLAKMASKMGKPDGLFVIEDHQLPRIFYGLELRDFTGIAKSMEARLHAAGIHTVESLCMAPKQVLRSVWGGVLGNRFWHLLRGEVIPDLVSARKSIGHSHVLPPDGRAPGKAWPILCKLLHKASERLRSHGLLAGSLTMQLAFFRGVSWGPEIRFPSTDSTFHLVRMLQSLWSDRPEPRADLIQVGVVLSRLVERGNHTPDLFQGVVADVMEADDEKHQRLDAVIDKLRARYGRQVVFFGSVQDARDAAPMRISFTHIPDPGLEQD
jgi:DNA polymerase-4